MRMRHASGRSRARIANLLRAACGAAAFLLLSASTPTARAATGATHTPNDPSLLPFSSAIAVDASAPIQTAQRQFNAGNYSAAITTLQSAVTQNPNSAEAYYWLGRTYYEIRDYDNAIAAAEKSVALDAKNSVYHQWLGTIYGGKADRDRSFSYARKVKKEFEEAVQLNPQNISARRDLEEYDLQAPWVVGGNKDEAKAQVDAIAAFDPVQGHLARGVYDMDGAKKSDLAEKEYREVLAARPAKLDAYLEVIAFFQQQNKPADMDTAIQAAALVAPNDPRLGYWRAASLTLANSNLADAEKYLKAYLASTSDRSDWPSHSAARGWLGRVYEAQGKRGEAAEQYRAALQLDPNDKDAKTRLDRLAKSTH
ncbi:MAG TPA: tetratricopeptide repeat protein [Candidatus Acidoferrales bacterium]|nr:tetratricopeptide repeat protein [Candidatus Acidoferrales bacterium]